MQWLYMLALAGIILDRYSKMWALHYALHKPTYYNNWLTLKCVFNKGVSFSMFTPTNLQQYILLVAIIATVLLTFVIYTWYCMRQGQYVLGHLLVMAGAVSNGVDRIWYSGVIDFIGIHINQWYWPWFNVADSMIVVGIIIIIYQTYILDYYAKN